jgi:hypothetical protein
MTDTVNSAGLRVITNASLTTSPDVGSTNYQFSDSDITLFSHGTGANQINQVWTDVRTVAASSTESLDLYGGLVSALNTTLNFTKVKIISIVADGDNTNNVLIGGSAAGIAGLLVLTGDAAIEDVSIAVQPGGMFIISAPKTGYMVTNTTGDILKITNSSSGSSVTYTIKIYGVV